MNIIIPACGVGKRFSEEMYSLPKPFISVLGQSMIVRVINSLNLSDEDRVVIAYKKGFYNFENYIRHNTGKNVVCIPIDFDTRGAVETIICAINNLDESFMEGNVAVIDCDTFYEEDVISKYKKMECKNVVGCFVDKSGTSVFSFVSLDEDGQVIEIAEKKRISNLACSGFYCFKSMQLLKNLCEEIITKNLKSNDEFYVSCLYRELIKTECVRVINIENPICVGTPFQLKAYCSNRPPLFEYRICFDLDNTLVTFPSISGDYSSVKPITKNIEYLRYLKNMGCKIIINTARKMKTAGNNVELATRLAKDQVYKTLQEFDIPYDEIYFGKPYAHVYVDDLSAHAMCDLDKQIGMYNTAEPARKTNKITFLGNNIVKISPDAKYQSFYYSNIPESLSGMFPKLFYATEDSITIEKINGITLSNLYINKSLFASQINMVLESLNKLHFFDKTSKGVQIYKNYSEKICKRYLSYDYSKFPKSKMIYENLMDFMVQYEREQRGSASIVHGDPVFSNILLTNDNIIRFIDVRGNLGGEPSIYGDRFYDYAKILQSIVGYEFVLHDSSIPKTYTSSFFDLFKDYVVKNFGEEKFFDIQVISSSLFFSLIPIHDNSKCDRYIELSARLLDKDFHP